PAEVNALRRCQRLALLVEDGDGLTAIGRKPGIIFGIHCGAECASLHSPASESRGDGRQRMAGWRELGRIALPPPVAALPADGEVVAHPEIAFAVEHALAARAVAATVKFQR